MKLFLTLSAVLLLAGNIHADTTVGAKYLNINAGEGVPGVETKREIGGAGSNLGVHLRAPLSHDVDLLFSLGRSVLSGRLPGSGSAVEGTETSVSALFYRQHRIQPRKRINLFLRGGGQAAFAELEIDGARRNEQDAGFIIGGGVEFVIGNPEISPRMSVKTGLNYHTIGDNTLLAEAAFNAWVGPNAFLRIGARYDFDSWPRKVYTGFGLGF